MLKGIFDVKSKTFWGVLLGLLGVGLEAIPMLEISTTLARIIEVVGFMIATMGLRDSMLESKANIIAKIVDIKSRTFWGAVIAGLVYIVDNSQSLPIPDQYLGIIQAVGVFLSVMGLRAAGRRTKNGKAPVG